MSKPPKIEIEPEYDILQTAPGLNFMKPTGYKTNIPIKEGDVFTVRHNNTELKFQICLKFYTNKHLALIELVSL